MKSLLLTILLAHGPAISQAGNGTVTGTTAAPSASNASTDATSINAMLVLLRQASALTMAQASAIESRLLANPDSLQDRTLLVQFYSLNLADPIAPERRSVHALWIIRNHPASAIAGQGEVRFANFEPEFKAARDIWQKHVKDQPNNMAILMNAGNSFIISDPVLSEKFYLKGKLLQPDDGQWSAQLGLMYSLKARFPTTSNLPMTVTETALKSIDENEKAYAMLGRPHLLPSIAEMARLSGDLQKAARTATSAIRSEDPHSVHFGNLILGEIELADGNIDAAKHYLLASGKVSGSPVLGSFGPGMNLANSLLIMGERDTVVEYLKQCLTFWTSGQERLKGWLDSIEKGGTPTLPRNSGM